MAKNVGTTAGIEMNELKDQSGAIGKIMKNTCLWSVHLCQSLYIKIEKQQK